MRSTATRLLLAALVATPAAALLAPAPAAAQYSEGYNFLKAVRDRDGAKATEILDKPGTTVANVRDAKGETALHIVVRRRDATWLGFVLSHDANPNVRDNDGATPLGIAAMIGFSDGVRLLLAGKAQVDLANALGETPLILAVRNRDLATVKLLLDAGADPKLADRAAGMTARDYAAQDSRATTILQAIDAAKPAKPKAAVAGPKL